MSSVEEDMRDLLSCSGFEEINSESSNANKSGDDVFSSPLCIEEDSNSSPGLLKEKATKLAEFDWNKHLAQTKSKSAASQCFFQNPQPPQNRFEVDKRLEILDPKSGALCLGTVREVVHTWIYVSLNGCDPTHSQWLMCDDQNIHPIGFSLRTNGQLQPPMGYQPNMSNFHKYLESQLKDNEDGTSPACKDEWFKPIEDCFLPCNNNFEIGHKLEAVDPLSFNGRLTAATVVKIEGDIIELNFIGWSYRYNSRQKYFSRNLFPVGYSKKAGIELQIPPKTKMTTSAKKQAILAQKTSDQKTAGRPKSGRRSSVRSESVASSKTEWPTPEKQSRKRSSHGSLNRARKGLKLEATVRRLMMNDENGIASPQSNVSQSPNTQQNSGSNAKARKTFVLNKYKKQKQLDGNDSSPHSESQVLSNLRSDLLIASNRSHDIVLSVDPGEDSQITVYLNVGCVCGAFLNASKLRECSKRIGPTDINHAVRETVQQIVNAAYVPRLVLKKVRPGIPRIMSVTAEANGGTHVRAIPTFRMLAYAKEYLRDLAAALQLCPNLISTDRGTCSKCLPDEPSNKGRKRRSTPENDEEINPFPQVSKRLNEWTVAEVADSMAVVDKNVSNKFISTQIDGKALLLLSTDMIIKYMDIPFGPALKIMSHVETLKNNCSL